MKDEGEIVQEWGVENKGRAKENERNGVSCTVESTKHGAHYTKYEVTKHCWGIILVVLALA